MRILICLGLFSLVSGAGVLFAQTASSVNADSIASSVRESAVELAFRDFERTGYARVISPEQDGGFILFPFGHKRPTVRCPRLNACLIALEPGDYMRMEADRPHAYEALSDDVYFTLIMQYPHELESMRVYGSAHGALGE